MPSSSRLFAHAGAFAFLWIFAAGCHHAAPKTMGAPLASASFITVKEIKASKGKTVLIKGTMVEKCPVSGCWFKLKDGGGIVKIDAKAAGFVVTEIPLHTEITASGKVIDADNPTILATGIRYQ